MRTKNSRIPLVQTRSMVMSFHVLCQCLCVCVCVCIHIFNPVFPKPFENRDDMPFHLSIYQYIFLKNKDVLLYNHTAVIKIRKSAFMYYYHLIYGPSSDFAGCASRALRRKRKPQIRLCSFVTSLSSPLI